MYLSHTEPLETGSAYASYPHPMRAPVACLKQCHKAKPNTSKNVWPFLKNMSLLSVH